MPTKPTSKAATAAKGAKTAKPKAAAKPAARAAKAVAEAAPKPKTAAKPAKAPPPKPAAAAAPPPEPPRAAPEAKPAAGATLMDFLSSDQRQALESISANLARAALTAQGAFAEAAMRQADRPAALSPDPFNVAPALSEVMGRLAAQPDRLMRAQADLFARYTDLWRTASRRALDGSAESVVEPAKGDKRFADPGWSDNPMFDVMKQSYLLTSNWLNDLVSGVDGVDPLAKRRVEFFTKMLTDAFSPSNFLISNPAALKEIAETKGESLVRGMENFAADLARGEGQLSISQTDFEKFKVGDNVATAPGKVVFQNDIIQLLQFSPSTDKVHEIPLLIFPPWINKFYILDLRPENSMIRWLAAQGFTVFVASWVNPDAKLATKTFEDYMIEGVYAASQAVMTQCKVKEVNTVGYCIGGTLLSCSLAYMAAKGDKRIKSATFFAAQQDFSEAGDLLLFTDDNWLATVEKQMDEGGGVLSGAAMADTFNALRANDLIWSFFVNNYLMGKEPKPFDLLYWNSDQTRMPKTLHLFYLREFYQKNRLAKGELVLGGETLDMGKVKIPVFVQSSKEDHIAPMRSVYKGAKLFGGPTTFMMAGSGHIAGVINAPVANKYQHWTNPALPATPDEWIKGAEEHPGSWWPYWAKWLAERSGPMVAARDPAKGPLKPIEDAPGSFVKVKS
ncbi:class I poly(R)-hydroxyalkanoic acid synthase [Phenylobacterium montanum]|uniref:Class I poly(R)-hydroxyalkanoic acid synthase n=1 Tax=Phenylobacterium montanum TaxID=2823693 RepID=A0A975G1N8_9CAUL|nr:class I poly(R)-hydroxyalkanoic acid synthase [Caulobacter sp. S6]QUD88959.1 class I poly(R)-hydroxyalkanoic acid synthase [Caulobacter sp. S6]